MIAWFILFSTVLDEQHIYPYTIFIHSRSTIKGGTYMAVESFISNYKILTQFFRCSSSECYLAEDTTGTAPLGIITLWPAITLTEEEKQAEFLQKARGGTVQCGDKTVLIRDAGVQD